MRKILILLTLLIFVHFNLYSQNSDLNKSRFMDNVRFGGGFNMGVGSSYSTFSISPSAIYDFSNTFGAGISLTYVYVKNKSIQNSTTNLYGGSILALFKPINYLQLSTEYENLKINQKKYSIPNISQWQDALYFGIEYVTGNISMGLRYDVLFDKVKSITSSSALNPVFRVYF
ncbi:alpha-ketoglutarate decarboxylase [Lutibacter sp.]